MLYDPKFIINFPTKRHWKQKSNLQDIAIGLEALVDEVTKLNLKSIAVPPLGCGNGGLAWADVLPMIKEAFIRLPQVSVLIYEPNNSLEPKNLINNTALPNMTQGRAAVLGIMNRYSVPGYPYPLSLLEIQKLSYFMQEAGEPLRLKFEQGPYGPYADNLRHVLNKIEGHFIIGYGDGLNHPETPIELLPDARKNAEKFLSNAPITRERMDKVSKLIEGFETPYGMELLSSVHWVSRKHDEIPVTDSEKAILAIHRWNERKRNLMKPIHIKVAWDHLSKQNWI